MSTKSGSFLSIVYVQLGAQKVSVIRSSGVPATQGLVKVNEVSARTVHVPLVPVI